VVIICATYFKFQNHHVLLTRWVLHMYFVMFLAVNGHYVPKQYKAFV